MLTQTDVLIATRIYHDLNPLTGEEYELRDRMLRKACGSFALMKAGDKPGDLEVEVPYSLEEVFEWLRELPWQIQRALFWVKKPARIEDTRCFHRVPSRLETFICKHNPRRG